MNVVTVRPIVFWIGLFIVLLIWCGTSFFMLPPNSLPADTSTDSFSSERAQEILQDLLKENVPHPAGSPANAVIEKRITDFLKSNGYSVEIQSTLQFRPPNRYFAIRNIMTRLEGTEDGPAVMLVGHYDSVGGGAGASDDGLAYGPILEIARMLKSEGPFRNPILFLITDAEEYGLVGARAFVEKHPWAKDIGVVLNFEARGTKGRSLMFETSENNDWLISLYSKVLPNPDANSVMFEVYKRMPNDTDFSVFKRDGMSGMNFAIVENSQFYHTAYDDLDHLNLASLQHQGENALVLTRELANMDFSITPKSNFVYTDLFGLIMIYWPVEWSILIALVAAFFFIVSLIVLIQLRFLSLKSFGYGICLWLAIMVLSSFGGSGITNIVSSYSDILNAGGVLPLLLRNSYWFLTLLITGVVSFLFSKRVGYWEWITAILFWWIFFGIVTSIFIPGASYIFLIPSGIAVPILFFMSVSMLKEISWIRECFIYLLIILLFSLLIKLTLTLEIGFGRKFDLGIVIPAAFMFSLFAPIFVIQREKRIHLLYQCIFVLVIVIVGLLSPLFTTTYTKDTPHYVNLMYREDFDKKTAEWIYFGFPIPQKIMDVTEFERRSVHVRYANSIKYGNPSRCEPLGIESPTLSILSNEVNQNQRIVKTVLQPASGADRIVLFISDTVLLDRIEMNEDTLKMRYINGYNTIAFYGVPDDGYELTFYFNDEKPSTIMVINDRYGLPPEGKKLSDARFPDYVPIQWGDSTRIIRRFQF
jgi:hypothetical protein